MTQNTGERTRRTFTSRCRGADADPDVVYDGQGKELLRGVLCVCAAEVIFADRAATMATVGSAR